MWQQLFPASKSLPPALFPVLDLDGILKPVCHRPRLAWPPHACLSRLSAVDLLALPVGYPHLGRGGARGEHQLRYHCGLACAPQRFCRHFSRPGAPLRFCVIHNHTRIDIVIALLQLEIRDYNKLPPKLRQYAKKIHEIGAKVG